ncbi:MAG: hypothetical protein KF745_10670 [Phycisphaeraceae bacterium]|nr:hypothetical protein [Phycisphaeraceae bacterium]
MTRVHSNIALSLSMSLFCAPAGAQPSVVIKVGDPLLAIPAGQSVVSIGSPATDHAAGFAVTVQTEIAVQGGTRRLSHIWGQVNGDPPALLRTESFSEILPQAEFEAKLGVSKKGQIAYSAEMAIGSVGFKDSVWVDDTLLAIQSDVIPGLEPERFWRFTSRPGITTNGTPYWLAGLAGAPGGLSLSWGLFFGHTPEPVLIYNQLVPGLAEPLSSIATVGPAFGFSPAGDRYIAEVTVADHAGPVYQAVVLDGTALVAGDIVLQGRPVVAAGRRPPETWASFQQMGITGSGHWFLAATTSDPSVPLALPTAILMIDGEIQYRTGNIVDGAILGTRLRDVAINENRDIVFVWDVHIGSVTGQALFINGRRVVTTGDSVDLTGDGLADYPAVVASLRGVDGLVVADRDLSGYAKIHFVGNIDDNGVTPSTAAYSALMMMNVHPGSPCRSDWDHNGIIEPTDIAAFIQSWSADIAQGTTIADFDNTGVTDSADLAAFINAWTTDLIVC